MTRLTLHKSHDHCVSGKPRLVVVMIHGIASDSHTYNAALDYLEDRNKLRDVRFVTFDLLGSGKSLKDDSLNYDYRDQLTALHNALSELEIGDLPLVLVGHSLGTFIVTRYVKMYPGEVSRLILISPPVYTEKDFDNPAFAVGIEAFKKGVSIRNSRITKEKSFINSMDKIVLDRKNYAVLAKTKVPTTIIYGAEDQLIASYNMPKLVRENHHIKSIPTIGRHGVLRDKYSKIPAVLEVMLTDNKVKEVSK